MSNKMNLLRDIVIKGSQSLENITYSEDDDDEFHIIRVKIGKDIYEFKFDSQQNCCERAFFLSHPGKKYSKKQENTLVFDNSIVGKTISRISLLYTDSFINGVSLNDKDTYIIKVLFINENNNNDTIYTLIFSNTHNGYYPRELIVNLYENNDENPMKIFSTRI